MHKTILITGSTDGIGLEAAKTLYSHGHHILLHGLIAKSKDPAAYEVVGRFLSFDPYALMLPRDDSAMRLVVNRTLAGLFRSGEIKDIYNKWFMSDIPGSQALMVPMGDTLETNFAVQAFPK